MNDTPATRRTLNDHEHMRAMGLLSTHLQQHGAEFAYANGYSDQRIADEVGVTLANIAGLRLRAFGRLAKDVEFTTDPRVSHLIAAHDAFVADVAAIISELNPGARFDPAPYLVGETK